MRLSEIGAVRGRLGLPVERDRHWRANGTIDAYVDASRRVGRVVDRL